MLTLIGSLPLYFLKLQKYIEIFHFGASLVAMFLICMWFAYDASCMNERLSPDEYMQGMVFFYTDMVLFLFFLSIIFFACFACEGGDCACYGTADIVPIGGTAGTNENDEEENSGREVQQGGVEAVEGQS
jgi:hypothetical protein